MSDHLEGDLESSANGDLDAQRVRAAHNQSLFREVNERIDELVEQWVGDDSEQYVCECLNPMCAEVLHGLSREEYRKIRCDPREFVVLVGHEQLDVEAIVETDPRERWLIVRKIGVGAKVAEQIAAEEWPLARRHAYAG